MFRFAAFLGLIGLAAATCVIIWSGSGQVAQALAQAGWGISVVALFHTVPLLISSASWLILVPRRKRLSFAIFTYFMWIRASVNNLMPVARIGGEIAAVRVMEAHGMRRAIAVASTVVELTVSVVAIFTFIIAGVILFALHISDKDLVAQLAWGIGLSLPVIAALLAVQKIGFFGLLARVFRALFRERWTHLAGSGEELDRTVTRLYRRHKQVLASYIMQLIAWGLGSVDIALCLYFLGHSLPFQECVMIEALIQASSSAAFAVPGALGVQEAGFLVFGGLLGLSHDIAAAMAVIRRCRDLICYVPGLIVWQMHEGRRLLK